MIVISFQWDNMKNLLPICEAADNVVSLQIMVFCILFHHVSIILSRSWQPKKLGKPMWICMLPSWQHGWRQLSHAYVLCASQAQAIRPTFIACCRPFFLHTQFKFPSVHMYFAQIANWSNKTKLSSAMQNCKILAGPVDSDTSTASSLMISKSEGGGEKWALF